MKWNLKEYTHTHTHKLSPWAYPVATVSWVHVLEEMEVSSVLTCVLPGLHLAVDHTCIISLTVHVVDLRQEGCILRKTGTPPSHSNRLNRSLESTSQPGRLTVRVG